MKVAREVQIDIFHRHDLSHATSGCASFHPKTWAKTGFPQANERPLANPVQAIADTYRCRCLPFPCRCRADRSDQNELSIRFTLQ